MSSVLAYHKVDNRFELGLTTVSPKSFSRHLTAIQSAGFKIECGRPDSERVVCLTFDDGYDCFYRNVVPSLDSRGAKAIVFVISGFMGSTNSWDVRLSYKPFRHMTAKQVEEVAKLGFTVGSHTRSHKDLTRLDAASLSSELRDSKKQLEDVTGAEVDALSFPYGRYNQRAAEAAFEAGYKRLFGLGSVSREGVIARTPVYSIDSVPAVLRKLESNSFEIFKSDIIHSFANVSALLSSGKRVSRLGGSASDNGGELEKTRR